jgi:hypothetical protein
MSLSLSIKSSLEGQAESPYPGVTFLVLFGFTEEQGHLVRMISISSYNKERRSYVDNPIIIVDYSVPKA